MIADMLNVILSIEQHLGCWQGEKVGSMLTISNGYLAFETAIRSKSKEQTN